MAELAELPPELRANIEDQAQARVDMSIQGYAKYLTPEAVDTLRGSFQGMPPRVGRFEIDSVEEAGNDVWVDVRYFIRDDSFVVRSRWSKKDEGWKVTHAERVWAEGEKMPGFLSRLLAKLLAPLARSR